MLQTANEDTKLIGYVETYQKVRGLDEETHYSFYDKNYNKLGSTDGYGRTYKISPNGKQEYLGTGTIIESCKMIFKLDIGQTIQLVNIS